MRLPCVQRVQSSHPDYCTTTTTTTALAICGSHVRLASDDQGVLPCKDSGPQRFYEHFVAATALQLLPWCSSGPCWTHIMHHGKDCTVSYFIIRSDFIRGNWQDEHQGRSWGQFHWKSHCGPEPLRVGVAASQFDLPSLTPLSVGACGRLQLGATHLTTSVALLK